MNTASVDFGLLRTAKCIKPAANNLTKHNQTKQPKNTKSYSSQPPRSRQDLFQSWHADHFFGVRGSSSPHHMTPLSSCKQSRTGRKSDSQPNGSSKQCSQQKRAKISQIRELSTLADGMCSKLATPRRYRLTSPSRRTRLSVDVFPACTQRHLWADPLLVCNASASEISRC